MPEPVGAIVLVIALLAAGCADAGDDGRPASASVESGFAGTAADAAGAEPSDAGTSADNSRKPRSGQAETSAVSRFRTWIDESGCITTATVNRRFTPVALFHGDSRDRLLLTETFELEVCERLEGPSVARISVAAAPLHADRIGEPLWSFEARGELGEVWGPLYRVREHGCCGARDHDTYYSLATGNLRFVATDSLIRIDVPNSPFIRFLAYHDGDPTALTPDSAYDPGVIGVVQYGGAEADPARLVLVSDERVAYEVSGIALLVDGEPQPGYVHFLWSADHAADRRRIGGFSAVLELQPTGVPGAAPFRIEIPVVADTLAIDAAALPTDVRARR